MKDLLAEAGVPDRPLRLFTRSAAAIGFLRSLDGPWVVKTDGLAAGKGVLVTDSLAEAEADVTASCRATLRRAGRRVVIEEGLTGPECSLLVLCDGERLAPLAPAQDHKRPGDGDPGPTPGAWAPSRRCPSSTTGSSIAGGRGRGPPAGGAAAAGDRLPGRPLRRAHAHAVGPEGARVQRALRRPRDPGGPAPLRRRPGRASGRGGRGRAGDRRRGSRPRPPCAWCWRPRAIPRRPRTGDPIDRPRRRAAAARRHRLPRRHGARPRGRRRGHLRRPGARRDRPRATPWPRPGPVPMPGVDAISWPGMHHRTDIALRRPAPATRPGPAGRRHLPPSESRGTPMIPRYAPNEMAAALRRRGPVRHVAAGRAAGHRRLGRGRRRPRRRRPRLPGARARRRRRLRRGGGRARAGHRPRRRRVRRRRPGAPSASPRARGSTTA